MITGIRLQNFRNYKDSSFEFEPGVNIIVGPNASGKTNLLESVLLVAHGSSYRVRDIDLVQFGKPWLRVDAFDGSVKRTVKMVIQNQKTEKTHSINGKVYKRLGLEHTIPVVLFEPNHLQLITQSPEQRRQYLDDLLERTQIGFKKINNTYRRALAQRNALLKQNPAVSSKQLFAWNIRLSQLASEIIQARTGLISELNQVISQIYSQIAGHKSMVEVRYESPFKLDNYSSQLLSKLESSTSLDFERGFTAYGPHREDISFYLNHKTILQSASRGEIRSLVLALKIFELNQIGKARGQRPLFLLDDVFSELDAARRKALVKYLKDYQSLITTTDADAVIEYFAGGGYQLISIK